MNQNKLFILTIAGVVASSYAQGQSPGGTSQTAAPLQKAAPSAQAGYVYKPDSSQPAGVGRAHTNYVLRSANGRMPVGVESFGANALVVAGPDSTVQLVETPCSLGNLYVDSPTTPCVPSFTAQGGPSAGGYGVIALVDAYDNPQAAADLVAFDTQFGLTTARFKKIKANNSCAAPPVDKGWALEESLDIEWAHVFAPNAQIVLVEACSNSVTDLVFAEQLAFNYIVQNGAGGGQVSNSWGSGEFSGQLADDAYFIDKTYNYVNGYTPSILAFASAGDSGAGAGWPSSNPWVVSAGGTSILRDASTLAFSSESCWGGSGGGISSIEAWTSTFTGAGGGGSGPWANYQYPIFGEGNRATPDMSFDADPASGVYVYSKINGGWFAVGGTSVSSPALAGIVNRSNNRLGSVELNAVTGGNAFYANAENNLLYAQLGTKLAYAANFYDVQTGSNGDAAGVGYDLCTGVGSPRGKLGK